jgi:hypothetical protein
MSNKERFNRSISLTKKQGRLDRAHKPLHSKLTQYEINAKLKKIAEFDHGQTSVNAMKKYCTDAEYRRRVHDFNRAIVDVFKANKHRYKISKEKY